MATFQITIPDAQATRARNALCAYIGADQTTANAKAGLAQLVKNTVRAQEADAAHAAVVPPTEVDVT